MRPEEEIIQIFKEEGIDLVATLPCEKIKHLYALIPKHFRHVPLTREEEGVGICAGAYLAGARPAMLIQSSGVGNALNALGSLTKLYQLPLPILVSWRGIYKEEIPAQIPMGRHLPRILEAFDVNYTLVKGLEDLPLIGDALDDAYENSAIHAVLLSPKIWERTDFNNTPEEKINRRAALSHEGKTLQPTLTRFEIIRAVAPYLDGKVVVCNLGFPSKELYHIKHQRSNFYMLGSMGMASPIGLGTALCTEKSVVVIDGDGSLLMNPGTLATIAYTGPKNLTLIAIDNGAHGSTGDQPTATNYCVDLEEVARGFGFENAHKVAGKKEICETVENLGLGPNFVHALAKPGNAEVPNIPLTPIEIKEQVMEFLRK